MAPSLVSSDDENEEEEMSMLSEEDLKRMNSFVERRERKSKRKQDSRIKRDDKLVQVVGVDEEAKRMKLGFHVVAVSKPLLAVKRIVEKGNHVVLGPGSEDNFIK
eukprot:10440743-Karenia_brevis.AAC.1